LRIGLLGSFNLLICFLVTLFLCMGCYIYLCWGFGWWRVLSTVQGTKSPSPHHPSGRLFAFRRLAPTRRVHPITGSVDPTFVYVVFMLSTPQVDQRSAYVRCLHLSFIRHSSRIHASTDHHPSLLYTMHLHPSISQNGWQDDYIYPFILLSESLFM
jgi:hypothetical protein